MSSGSWYWGNQTLDGSKHGNSKFLPRKELKPPSRSSTFHNVLLTLISCVRQELIPKATPTILQPPSISITSSLHPETVVREDREYFASQRIQARAKQDTAAKRADMLFPGYRNPDNGHTYPFDRTLSMYESKRQGARKSPAKPKRSAVAAYSGKDGGSLPWSTLHQLTQEQTRARVEHLIDVLTRELHKEVDRENRIALCSDKKKRRVKWAVSQERAEAADWIMRMLQDYRMVSAITAMEYLMDSVGEDSSTLAGAGQGGGGGSLTAAVMSGVRSTMRDELEAAKQQTEASKSSGDAGSHGHEASSDERDASGHAEDDDQRGGGADGDDDDDSTASSEFQRTPRMRISQVTNVDPGIYGPHKDTKTWSQLQADLKASSSMSGTLAHAAGAVSDGTKPSTWYSNDTFAAASAWRQTRRDSTSGLKDPSASTLPGVRGSRARRRASSPISMGKGARRSSVARSRQGGARPRSRPAPQRDVAEEIALAAERSRTVGSRASLRGTVRQDGREMALSSALMFEQAQQRHAPRTDDATYSHLLGRWIAKRAAAVHNS